MHLDAFCGQDSGDPIMAVNPGTTQPESLDL